MKAKGRRREANRKKATPEPPGTADRVRPWLLGATTCLIVARPFTPGAGQAQNGQGSLFVLLWLLLLAGWLLALLRTDRQKNQWQFRFAPLDAAVIVLFGWYTICGAIAVVNASPRPAINSLWQWVSMFVGYLLIRQLFTSRRQVRALIAVMSGLAVAMAAIGLVQYFVDLPAARGQFEAAGGDVEALYDLTGEWLPPDSPERERYEARLNSPEPMATFALTNSLAGLLAPWFVVLVGVGLAARRPPNQRSANQRTGRSERLSQRPGRSDRLTRLDHPGRYGRTRLLCTIVALLVIASCLFLTHSRSAQLATLFGLVLLWAFCVGRGRLRWSILLGMLGVAFLVCVVLFFGGMLGRTSPLVSSAERSVGYRLQYWQSTWEMIADVPIFGCGPGQFQESYTAYKLPSASEEIADPHNFLLEVWSTAGTPELLALLTVLAILGIQSSRHAPRDEAQNSHHGPRAEPHHTDCDGYFEGDSHHERCPQTESPSSIYAGAAAGLALGPGFAFLDHLPVPFLHAVIALVVAPAAIWSLSDWVDHGRIPPWLLTIGIVVLSINLLAAGGIGEPAVAGTLWVLAPLLLVVTQQQRTRRSEPENHKELGLRLSRRSPQLRRLSILAMLLTTAAALSLAYGTAYSPVFRCRDHLSQASDREIRRRPPAVLRALNAATAADPWSAIAARRLADVHLEAWRAERSPAALVRWSVANERTLTLSPLSARQWQASASTWAEIWRQTGSKDHLRTALRDWHRSIARYPSNALFHAEFAVLLRDAGESTDSLGEANRAIHLDDQMRSAGHHDRFLPVDLRHQVEEIANTTLRKPSN